MKVKPMIDPTDAGLPPIETLVPRVIPEVPRPMSADERRANALADIQKMSLDLIDAQEQIAQLKADLNRESDRCSMLVEERNRYRSEALTFRSELIKLATKQSDIALLCVAAEDVIKVVHELTNAVKTPTSDVLDKLEKDLNL